MYVHKSKFFKKFNWYQITIKFPFLFAYVVEFPPHVRIFLLEKMADVEHRLSAGCSEKLQLGSLVAAFDTVKYLIAKEVSWPRCHFIPFFPYMQESFSTWSTSSRLSDLTSQVNSTLFIYCIYILNKISIKPHARLRGRGKKKG